VVVLWNICSKLVRNKVFFFHNRSLVLLVFQPLVIGTARTTSDTYVPDNKPLLWSLEFPQ
jgi:hypothetical protein